MIEGEACEHTFAAIRYQEDIPLHFVSEHRYSTVEKKAADIIIAVTNTE